MGYHFSGFKQSSKLVMWNKYHLSMKGIGEMVPFPSKMIYKRVRGWTLGRRLPILNFLVYPPGSYRNSRKRALFEVTVVFTL